MNAEELLLCCGTLAPDKAVGIQGFQSSGGSQQRSGTQ